MPTKVAILDFLKQDIDEAIQERRNKLVECLSKQNRIVTNGDLTNLKHEYINELEENIKNYCEILCSELNLPEFVPLLELIKPFFVNLPKARIYQILSMVIGYCHRIDQTGEKIMELCEIIIKWCKELRFEFLQYRIEFKLIQVMINFKQFDKAYSSISTLISYVQKSEDKLLLLDLYLTQCSLGIIINNVSQAVSFLTNAKTVASSINTPLELQFKIELLSGILQADVSDYRTAVPYLQEAFDIAESLNNIENGTQALMYMLLCFMLSDDVDNLARIMKSNFCLKLVDDSRIKGMLNLINAYMSKDINKYREVIQDPNFSLKDEQTIVYHLEKNYESVVDNSIMDIVYAYSHLQLNFIAQKISLPVSVVSTQLEKMIIDGKINGILDESLGVLIQYKATVESEEIYKSNQICENLSQVANKLFKYCDLLK